MAMTLIYYAKSREEMRFTCFPYVIVKRITGDDWLASFNGNNVNLMCRFVYAINASCTCNVFAVQKLVRSAWKRLSFKYESKLNRTAGELLASNYSNLSKKLLNQNIFFASVRNEAKTFFNLLLSHASTQLVPSKWGVLVTAVRQ